jgi:hypothetical protein
MPPPITYKSKPLTFGPLTQTLITSATAHLDSSNMTGGSGPSSHILPPGWGGGSCPFHHNRGHLIGNHLGGPGNDPNNLVTLTAGTNHPFMYEFEDAVRRFVLASPGYLFDYQVECIYDGYTKSPGFTISGASSNPFCLFPAPAALRLSLKKGGTLATLGEISSHLPKPHAVLGPTALHTNCFIYNGGYKLYTGDSHTVNSCWSVIQNPYSPPIQVQAAAVAFAKLLGY